MDKATQERIAYDEAVELVALGIGAHGLIPLPMDAASFSVTPSGEKLRLENLRADPTVRKNP
jgi:hypothetical protein